jgi:alanine racemase
MAQPFVPLSSATLTVDLDAVAANYVVLRRKCAPAACGAVVKANAYGLGAAEVATRLAAEGCRHFFVAHPGEGLALRALGDPAIEAAEIFVFGGLSGEPASILEGHRMVPVLGSPEDVAAWRAQAHKYQRRLPAIVFVDTGMNRYGLAGAELRALAQNLPASLDIYYVMSHLACADEPAHKMNELQRLRLAEARALMPGIKASLANSSGIFLGAGYHLDLVRPGAALYGLNPTGSESNPMRDVVRLETPIVQVRCLARDDTIGYGATYRARGPMRIATIGVGYADGYPRSLGGKGTVFIAGLPAPVVGRVSMDFITVDVTAIDEQIAHRGATAELIGPHMPADTLARAAGTVGYEILTMLGPRYVRMHKGLAGGAQ